MHPRPVIIVTTIVAASFTLTACGPGYKELDTSSGSADLTGISSEIAEREDIEQAHYYPATDDSGMWCTDEKWGQHCASEDDLRMVLIEQMMIDGEDIGY